jgi:ornithine decarboxylase
MSEIGLPSPGRQTLRCAMIQVSRGYEALRRAMPSAEIYYAVKANPAPKVVSALAALGANFDLASPGEIDICLGLNIPPERLPFGNTIKRKSGSCRSVDRRPWPLRL